MRPFCYHQALKGYGNRKSMSKNWLKIKPYEILINCTKCWRAIFSWTFSTISLFQKWHFPHDTTSLSYFNKWNYDFWSGNLTFLRALDVRKVVLSSPILNTLSFLSMPPLPLFHNQPPHFFRNFYIQLM